MSKIDITNQIQTVTVNEVAVNVASAIHDTDNATIDICLNISKGNLMSLMNPIGNIIIGHTDSLNTPKFPPDTISNAEG